MGDWAPLGSRDLHCFAGCQATILLSLGAFDGVCGLMNLDVIAQLVTPNTCDFAAFLMSDLYIESGA